MTGCRPRHSALAVILASAVFALTACTELGDMGDKAVNYNVAADVSNNQQILLNLVRQGHERTAEWSSFRLITDQTTLGGMLMLASPLGGRGADTARVLTPQANLSSQSAPQIDVLDAREFYQQYLKELPIEFIANFFHEDNDAWLYFLFVKSVIISAGPDQRIITGNPGSAPFRLGAKSYRPGFAAYEQALEALYAANLVPEVYEKASTVGPPLTAAEVKHDLRAVAAATTASDKDARLSLDSTKDTGQYQLKRKGQPAHYCLRADAEISRVRLTETRSPLIKAALASRCNATEEDIKAWDDEKKKLKLKEPTENASLVLLDSDQCRLGLGSGLVDRYCKLVSDAVRLLYEGNIPRTAPRLVSVKILTRSTSDVVEFLGRMAAWSYLKDQTLNVPEYSKLNVNGAELKYTRACGVPDLDARYICLPFLVVNNGKPDGPVLAAIDFEGETYWVPADPARAGLSTLVFDMVHQLIAYAKVAKDLSTILTVTPIP